MKGVIRVEYKPELDHVHRMSRKVYGRIASADHVREQAEQWIREVMSSDGNDVILQGCYTALDDLRDRKSSRSWTMVLFPKFGVVSYEINDWRQSALERVDTYMSTHIFGPFVRYSDTGKAIRYTNGILLFGLNPFSNPLPKKWARVFGGETIDGRCSSLWRSEDMGFYPSYFPENGKGLSDLATSMFIVPQ